ncbi:MAG: MFS transporter [Polyangiales bacterium]
MSNARRAPVAALVLAAAALPIARRLLQTVGDVHGGRTSSETLANCYTAVIVAQILGAPLMGIAAARLGGRKVLLASLLAFALSSVWSVMWFPPTVLIALFALGGLGQVGGFCAIVAVVDEIYPKETGKIANTALLAATAVGAVLAGILWTLGVVTFGMRSLALLAPPVLLAVFFVARKVLRAPVRETRVTSGDGYRDVQLVEAPQVPWSIAIERPVLLSMGLFFGIGAVRGLENGALGYGLFRTAGGPAAVIGAVIAIWIVVRARRWIELGLVVPLAAVVVFTVFRTLLGLFALPIATNVAATVATGALPFVLSRERGAAPVLAGAASSVMLLASTVWVRHAGWTAGMVAVLAAIACALSLRPSTYAPRDEART